MYENDPRYLPPPERGMGCVAKGCLTFLAVGVILVVMLGGLGWWVARSFSPFLDQHPTAIRVFPATDDQYQAVQDKLASVSGEGSVSFSSNDINILIARDPRLADLRGKLYLTIDKGKLTADVTVPVNDESAGSSQRVFFNGRIGFDASFADGDFTLVLRRIESLGGGQPPTMVAWVTNHPDISRYVTTELNDRFHDGLRHDSSLASFFGRVHTMIVKDDRVIVTLSPPPSAVATPSNPP